ncbi:fibronectin type III domain-containing protein [Patescibacteria group bacterium]
MREASINCNKLIQLLGAFIFILFLVVPVVARSDDAKTITATNRVRGVEVTKRLNKKVRLRWDKVKSAGRYQVRVTNASGRFVKKVRADENKATVKGLKPRRTYRFRVRARKGGEYKGYSRRVSARTTWSRKKTLFADSIWWEPLGDNETIDARSDKMRRGILFAFDYTSGDSEGGLTLTRKRWTVPVYFVNKNTPKYDVEMTASWAPADNMALKDVPIPDDARPDPATDDDGSIGDAEMAIIDVSQSPWVEYDFWQAEKNGGQWEASWANRISLGSEGMYPCGLSARGSGAALAGGLIWPAELKRGRINHKLAFSFPYNHDNGPVAPMTENDGRYSPKRLQNLYENKTGETDAVYPLIEGAVLQLDPSIDLKTFEVTDPDSGKTRTLKKYERTIARAMQEYGMVDVDNGGSFTFYAVHPYSFAGNPYENTLPSQTYIEMPRELLENVHVLETSKLRQDPDTSLTMKQWNRYSCDGSDCGPTSDDICQK